MLSESISVLCYSDFLFLNREDEFDLDLEDIMIMEAIWLSIQVNEPAKFTCDLLSLSHSL